MIKFIFGKIFFMKDNDIKEANSDTVSAKLKWKVTADEGNVVELYRAKKKVGALTIKGKGNEVFFGELSSYVGNITIQGDENKVFIGDDSVIRARILIKGHNQRVFFGQNTTIQSCYILCQESCNIEIGDWCMFSRDIEIRTTDAHSVVDVKTRERINKPASVKIGNHVWVGVGSLISKGTIIPDDSIVGAYSFVNKEFVDENVLIAGAPAKIVRYGVTWNRGRKPKFSKAQLEHWKETQSKEE
ncbi:acyltransferase [Vreelandella olivaria]|uniref:acyltransferase n=1 Tax=Vreelandella olivaria TaxID=390919 RepID=UPI00201F91B4|nr:acyltransferase [Halomonas olivaria]